MISQLDPTSGMSSLSSHTRHHTLSRSSDYIIVSGDIIRSLFTVHWFLLWPQSKTNQPWENGSSSGRFGRRPNHHQIAPLWWGSKSTYQHCEKPVVYLLHIHESHVDVHCMNVISAEESQLSRAAACRMLGNNVFLHPRHIDDMELSVMYANILHWMNILTYM